MFDPVLVNKLAITGEFNHRNARKGTGVKFILNLMLKDRAVPYDDKVWFTSELSFS